MCYLYILILCCVFTVNAIHAISTEWTYVSTGNTTQSAKCPVDPENLIASTLGQWPRPNRTPDKDLFFAIIFYDDPNDELRHRITINAAIDVAVQRVQAVGGLLEGFNITTEYRDSQSSSLHGALAAWDLHYIHQPGSASTNPNNR